MFKLTGTVKVVKATEKKSERFSLREFVVTESTGMYPQDILFQLSNDKCSLLDGFNVNDSVEVSFNLRGREWTNPQGEVKYFNSLEAWRIDRLNGSVAPSQNANAGFTAPVAPTSTPVQLVDSSDDDLPF